MTSRRGEARWRRSHHLSRREEFERHRGFHTRRVMWDEIGCGPVCRRGEWCGVRWGEMGW
eukprot:319886-Rhodomonas_salina.1